MNFLKGKWEEGGRVRRGNKNYIKEQMKYMDL